VEREITQWVDLCDASGVRPDALGWTRRPLHRCRIDGPWGRRKRWHHWAVTSPREIVLVTFADLDFAGLAVIAVTDRRTGVSFRDVVVRPGGWRAPLPEVADRGRVEVNAPGLVLELVDTHAEVRIRARSKRAELDVRIERPAGHESLAVATAWPDSSGQRFAYSSKQAGLPASGTVNGRALADGAVACLDWGRGVWPARTRWNWASAADRETSFNLGAQWTHDAHENAVVVGGKLSKIGGEVRFEWNPRDPRAPWHLRGDGVDLTLTPEHVEGVPRFLRVAFGTFRGTIAGARVRDLFGWAEELSILW
jgi:hypothetical protein